jgi:hypothetical protein
VQPFLIAAGGGGDVIAATLIAQPEQPRPVIATWAWDRLSVDPLPGPRGFADFEGLENPADLVYVITADTRPIPPSGSTLPALADALDADLVLLDPGRGCLGLARQIEAAAHWCGAREITVVDVGGDALGRPGDHGLRSPLADITSLVATAATGLPARLVVLGPGADGELAPDLLDRRLHELGAKPLPPVHAARARALVSILEWHPSEATALVVMAALGCRGRVEIRDRGLTVDLTEDTPIPWQLPLAAAQPAPEIAEDVAATDTLASLEAAFQQHYDISEIQYEREKAAKLDSKPEGDRTDRADFLQAAHDRGTQWVTRRRLREATGTVPDTLARHLLIPTEAPATVNG